MQTFTTFVLLEFVLSAFFGGDLLSCFGGGGGTGKGAGNGNCCATLVSGCLILGGLVDSGRSWSFGLSLLNLLSNSVSHSSPNDFEI